MGGNAALIMVALSCMAIPRGASKNLGESGRGKVRVNSSGCLDRCSKGSVIVVYPEGVWYSLKSKEDVEEVMQTHLTAGNVVTRLLLG